MSFKTDLRKIVSHGHHPSKSGCCFEAVDSITELVEEKIIKKDEEKTSKFLTVFLDDKVRQTRNMFRAELRDLLR